MIENVVSNYVTLKKHGRNYLGICPFHEDNKPSLNVLPSKEIFKCFACGTGGNIVKFISKIENVDYLVAKKILYEKYKIENYKSVPVFKTHSHNENDQIIYQINQKTMEFYQYQLTTDLGSKALNYLKARNINWNSIAKFNLGYASSNNELLNYLLINDFSYEQLLTAGVIRENNQDKFVDVFKNRIMFPIISTKGNVVGFSGRSLENNSKIKYLNTAENSVFVKGNNLYNITNCLNSNKIYLVEGYMDAIAASQLGLNASAIMGSNLSNKQEQLLANNFQDIKLFLDNDAVGINAARKIAEQLSKYQNVKITIISNPSQCKDLSELITNYSNNQILLALNENDLSINKN